MMRSEADIQGVVDRIAAEFQPRAIILFGSYARGTANEESDVDLLVIMPFSTSPYRAIAEIFGKVHPSFPVDVVVRHPDTLKQRLADGDPLLREALSQGITIYGSAFARIGVKGAA